MCFCNCELEFKLALELELELELEFEFGRKKERIRRRIERSDRAEALGSQVRERRELKSRVRENKRRTTTMVTHKHTTLHTIRVDSSRSAFLATLLLLPHRVAVFGSAKEKVADRQR